jgi:hypothetical protein
MKRDANVLEALVHMENRLKVFNTADVPVRAGVADSPSLGDWTKGAIEAVKNTTPEKAQAALAAARQDPARQLALNEERVTQVTNFVRTNSNYGQWFDIEVLGESDQAIIENTTTYEMPIINLAGEEGTPPIQRTIAPAQQQLVPLRYRASRWHEYKMFDLQKGNIANRLSSMVDIGRDLTFDIDRIIFDLVTAGGGLGDFNFATGDKHRRTLHLHSGIDVNNLPTTNVRVCTALASGGYSKTANSGSSLFRLDVCREVLGYCAQWGDIFDDGPLAPTGVIYVNSKDAGQLGADIEPTTIGTLNGVTDNLLRDWFQFEYGGRRWTVIPDVTIPVGVCYPLLNKKVGKLVLKPVYNQAFTETDPQKNLERRMQARVIGTTIIEPWRMAAISVRYRS